MQWLRAYFSFPDNDTPLRCNVVSPLIGGERESPLDVQLSIMEQSIRKRIVDILQRSRDASEIGEGCLLDEEMEKLLLMVEEIEEQDEEGKRMGDLPVVVLLRYISMMGKVERLSLRST